MTDHEPTRAGSCVLVIFGAAGDLTRRLLLPALYNLARERRLPEQFAIVGFARTEVGEEALREQLGEGVRESAGDVDERTLDWLLSRFTYLRSDFGDERGWERLSTRLQEIATAQGGALNCLFYLATAPGQFMDICDRLGALQLLEETRGWRCSCSRRRAAGAASSSRSRSGATSSPHVSSTGA